MQKLDHTCMNRLMFFLFRLDVHPIARKIFPANLMAYNYIPTLTYVKVAPDCLWSELVISSYVVNLNM